MSIISTVTSFTNPVSAIGSVFDAIFGGGRSPAQIKADEQNSALSNQAGIKRVYNIDLSLEQVATILRPGWDAHENGTQLWNRINSFVENNLVDLQAKNTQIVGSLGSGSSGISRIINPTNVNNIIKDKTLTYFIYGASALVIITGFFFLVKR